MGSVPDFPLPDNPDNQLLDRKLAITDQQIDRLAYELHGLSDDEMRGVEDADG